MLAPAWPITKRSTSDPVSTCGHGTIDVRTRRRLNHMANLSQRFWRALLLATCIAFWGVGVQANAPVYHIDLSAPSTICDGQATAITATVTADGEPLDRDQVLFSVLSGSGTFDPEYRDTDVDGEASTTFTPGSGAGVLIRAICHTSCTVYIQLCQTPAAATIVSPVGQTSDLTPLVTWTATGYDRYQVQVVNVDDSQDAWDSGEVVGTESSIQVPNDLEIGATYSVKVKVGKVSCWADWSQEATFIVDTTAPTCTVTGPDSPTNQSPINFTITFSESVKELTVSDITVTGGSKGPLDGSGTTYTLPVTPSSQGAVTCQVPADSAQDAATNGNTVSNNLSITYDSAPPDDFTLSADPPSSLSNWVNTDVTVSFSTSDATSGMGHYEVSTDGTNYSSAGVVWPNIDFDDQLDSANKGASSLVDYVDGYWGDAADFGAADKYVHYAAVRFPAQGTIGFWMMGSYDAGRGNNTILDTIGTSTPTNGDLRVMLTSGNLIQLQLYSDGWQSGASTSQISPTNWTHVAMSYGNSGLKVFVSGSQEGPTGSAVARTGTDDVYVGDHQGDASSNAFNGSIDCIRVSGVQSDANIVTPPTSYTMSYVMTEEEEQTVYVKAIDKVGNERIEDIQTYIDKTDPTFTISQVNPATAKNNGNPVTTTFSSENLPTDPTVQVNGHGATRTGKSVDPENDNLATYTYTYSVQGSDPDGDATITFSGTDRAANSNTGSNTTALDIWAVQWSGAPLVDATGTVKLGWNYSHTFCKLDAEYSINGGASWSRHNLFDVTPANQSDYRFWSMGTGTRRFQVRIYETPSSSFVAGVTDDVVVPGSAPLPEYPYTDYLSNQRGQTYVPTY